VWLERCGYADQFAVRGVTRSVTPRVKKRHVWREKRHGWWKKRHTGRKSVT
jgi:hypothetical protein